VTFTPIRAENGQQTYAFTGELSYGALLRGVIEYLWVTRSGLEPETPCLKVLSRTQTIQQLQRVRVAKCGKTWQIVT